MTEKQRYKIYLICALGTSLLLHLSTTMSLDWLNKDPAPSTQSDPVKIKIVTPAKTKPTPPAKKIEPGETQQMDAEDIDSAEDTSTLKTAERPSVYSDLFPASNWPSGTIVTGKPASNAPASVSTQKLSGHLSGQLDIPLVFRENTADSKAVAKFRNKGSGGWYFEYIDGEPVLRAVLYQAFLKKENLDKINELAAELGKDEILFTVHQITKPALNGWKQFSDTISYNGNRIVFLRTIYTGSDGSSGMALPDEEAKRAVMRDKVALRRLMTSPAFVSPIRNKKIVTE